MTRDEMESHMEEVFRPMNREVNKYGWTFGQGHGMHADALKVAPTWLQKWDDKHRWSLCFTQGWKGLVILAKAFGWSKETLLDDLIYYKSKSTVSS